MKKFIDEIVPEKIEINGMQHGAVVSNVYKEQGFNEAIDLAIQSYRFAKENLLKEFHEETTRILLNTEIQGELSDDDTIKLTNFIIAKLKDML